MTTQYKKQFTQQLSADRFIEMVTSNEESKHYCTDYFRELKARTLVTFSQEVLDLIGPDSAIVEDIVGDHEAWCERYECSAYEAWEDDAPISYEYCDEQEYERDSAAHYATRPVKVLGFIVIS